MLINLLFHHLEHLESLRERHVYRLKSRVVVVCLSVCLSVYMKRPNSVVFPAQFFRSFLQFWYERKMAAVFMKNWRGTHLSVGSTALVGTDRKPQRVRLILWSRLWTYFVIMASMFSESVISWYRWRGLVYMNVWRTCSWSENEIGVSGA